MWGEWGPLKGCLSKNGVCKRKRERECDDPPPAHGGAMCAGSKINSVNCKPNACGRLSYVN